MANASHFDCDIFVGSNPTSLVMRIFYPVNPQNVDLSANTNHKLCVFLMENNSLKSYIADIFVS